MLLRGVRTRTTMVSFQKLKHLCVSLETAFVGLLFVPFCSPFGKVSIRYVLFCLYCCRDQFGQQENVGYLQTHVAASLFTAHLLTTRALWQRGLAPVQSKLSFAPCGFSVFTSQQRAQGNLKNHNTDYCSVSCIWIYTTYVCYF